MNQRWKIAGDDQKRIGQAEAKGLGAARGGAPEYLRGVLWTAHNVKEGLCLTLNPQEVMNEFGPYPDSSSGKSWEVRS